MNNFEIHTALAQTHSDMAATYLEQAELYDRLAQLCRENAKQSQDRAYDILNERDGMTVEEAEDEI